MSKLNGDCVTKIERLLREIESLPMQDTWIPCKDDVYVWRLGILRRPRVIWGVVESYDDIKRLVHGRVPNGAGERRHRYDVLFAPREYLADLGIRR